MSDQPQYPPQYPPQQPYGGDPQAPYGPPAQSHGSPGQAYGAPQDAYGAPQQPYGAPQDAYGAPQQPYGDPKQQPYGAFPQPPQPTAPDGRPLADPGIRLAARIVDSVVFALITATVAAVIAGSAVSLVASAAGTDSPLVPTIGISLVVIVVFAVQYVLEVEVPIRWNGQTVGKRALKIAMAPIEPYTALTRGRLTYRFLVALFFNVLANCYVGYVDSLWCLWDKPYRQCLHDKPARTVVVRVQPQ
ncbi:RDD family protein [Catenuloplanes japonicus]|uniref:RDD family protein n=1 Tax=Catenuloplanes japonicus TaxID=33876 RepID=UPI000524AD45|nr:RDD family protein [Catenuloplanes japonicus]